MDMVEVEQIAEWRGEDVVDSDGEKVGKLADVWFRVGTDDADYASVKSGLLGRHARLVPLAGASLSREYVRLAFTAEQIGAAPAPADDGVLTADLLRQVADAYGVTTSADARYESGHARDEREREAREARERAEELDEDARRGGAQAEDARRRAEEAQREAGDADDAAKRASDAAAEARHTAERADRPPAG